MTDQPDKIPAPPPKLYENIPFGQYLSWDAMSQSAVKPLAKSAAHYQAWLSKQENTKALRVGHITDTLVFEPDLWEDNYKVKPRTYKASDGTVKPWNGNATVCKQWMEDAETLGKIIISGPEYDEAVRVSTAVRGHPAAAAALSEGKSQVSMVWIDPDSGVLCKGRLDWLTATGIYDLKTTKEGGPEQHQFPRECVTYGYHIQAAFYTDGYEQLTGVALPYHLIIAEKGSPYAVGVRRMEYPSLLAGHNIYKRTLLNYKGCCERKKWPGFSDFIEPMNIPTWALRQELGDDEGDDDGI